MPQGGDTFVLEGQNLNFSENSEGMFRAHDFDHSGEG